MSERSTSQTPNPERIVLVGYGPVGARFVEELLPLVRRGAATLTVVGAENTDAYNRVLIAEHAVGNADRDSLEITDTFAAREAGVHLHLGVSVTAILRSRSAVSLSDGTLLTYDRLVLATGARANIPTLDGIIRVHRDRQMPAADAAALDTGGATLPRGVTVLRDLDDAQRVLAAVTAGKRIVVLGAGVLGMEIALAAASAGAQACVVYHGEIPMNRNLDRGGGSVLAQSARRAGVTMVNHSRAESLLFHQDDDGVDRFDALICADGKQIHGDLLLLSCGVGARTELAQLAGLPVSTGILVDSNLQSWGDPRVYAIGDCAHVAPARRAGESTTLPTGGPSGLIGPGWRQADWLARRFSNEVLGTGEVHALIGAASAVVMLKAEGIEVVSVGNTAADPWDRGVDGHAAACDAASLYVSQWADPEHGRYVKMVTREGILEGFICVGMPRTAAELTLLFERGSELPADRSVLLRYDGPDYEPSVGGAFNPGATVCWCNGVTVGAIAESAEVGNTSVACIGAATRAGTGCGGCKMRIGEVLERFATSRATS
ncbi:MULTISPECIES: FAD-dependent oxidoreductase [Cryobacterium]|jgi:assimilatory nitrate reductase electron transfer subunit|uniref:NAD(P)/FAD-dependent oxidoreductase n=1 Tax=Cryobacterium lyxosi TaxID=1259228 RepID=A0A4R8ZIG2_9MICO|nr:MULTISPECIES: FAD-dependent oxidoreductase [Cryobacterium]TFD28114.1 NAD(P)/FAD-dependent oxidoreductase [Cryobacterium lyxosi]